MEYQAREKYRSMLRAYKRLEEIHTGLDNEITNVAARDASEDFFNQCYHFKDWLKKDLAIVLLEDVEDYISSNNALSLAADYCNSLKHAGLDRSPRSGQQVEKINTHINVVLGPVSKVSSSLEITFGGKGYDAFTLATQCTEAWSDFLKLSKIDLT